MADRKGPTATAAPPTNKLAMSRALGAAFLSHQVEQLEKTVNGPGSGNWRARHQAHGNVNSNGPGRGGAAKRPPQPPVRKPAPEIGLGGSETLEKQRERERGEARARRRSNEKEESPEKDADVVVVDASVLVHALYQVKKWCREGREEIVIVPLEGTS
jgi:hypothetical protein